MNKINLNDTIAAISTPVGVGGIGIVRLSGLLAIPIAEKVFQATSKQLLSQFSTHTVHFGKIHDEKGTALDDVLVTLMRAPKTYTGEDVVEISGHGGTVVLKLILDLLLRQGARLADPGEFTRRAFLNGRMDLVQAEAVLDVIQAKTESSLRVSTQQLDGELSKELAAIREAAMELYGELETGVNFPEEGVDVGNEKDFEEKISLLTDRVQKLLETSDEGRILKEGIRVVLCGRPNVGKSSLLNALLRQPRAIVSSIAGTTRDTIEETVQVNGIALQLVDTAGVLEPRDEIEVEAIRRSRSFVQSADLVLFLLDASQPLTKDDEKIREGIADRPILAVLNKCDLKTSLSPDQVKSLLPKVNQVRVSALMGEGVDQLKTVILQEALHGQTIGLHRLVVTNLRHVESLRQAQSAFHRAKECLVQKLSEEFISEEIKSAILALDRITGRDADADLLEQIFSNFCIGK